MGYYYYFWPAPPSGMAEQLTPQAVSEWLERAYRVRLKFPDDYKPAVIELAEQMLAGLQPPKLGPEDYAAFDELVHSIYVNTSDESALGGWLPPEATTDTMAYRWYAEAFEKVEPTLSPTLRQLLRWPLIGRPIWRDAQQFPYISEYGNHTNMSYWTAAEVEQIWQEWPFDAETTRTALYALREALAHAKAQGAGLTILNA